MKRTRLGVAAALTAAVALSFSACAANEGGSADPAASGGGESLSGTLTGIGASSMATAQETWVPSSRRRIPT